MFLTDRGQLVEALYVMGTTCCSYSVGEEWAERCDCKYGVEMGRWPTAHEQGCGCPELHCLYEALSVMTDEEWALLAHRSQGVLTEGFSADPATVADRLARAMQLARQAEAHVAALRELLTLEPAGRKRS